jgi:hypothetical protein
MPFPGTSGGGGAYGGGGPKIFFARAGVAEAVNSQVAPLAGRYNVVGARAEGQAGAQMGHG